MSVTDNKNDILAVLQVLKKYNLKDTEIVLKREANLTDISKDFTHASDSVLQTYQSKDDPNHYDYCYNELRKFIDSSLDVYKYELSMILYPVFVNMYIELLYNGHEDKARELMKKFGPEQEYYYQDDIKRLAIITKRNQMFGNDLIDTFKSNEFIVRISRETLSLLKRHLQNKKASILMNILNEHIYFDLYEGVVRNKKQCDATAGALLGEARRQDNKIKVYYGLLKEPDYQQMMTSQQLLTDEDDESDLDAERQKRKKLKKDLLFGKKTKLDPNAPVSDRVYLPQLRDIDINEKIKALRDAQKRISLGPDSLPSVCYYTLLNSLHTVTCAEITDDSFLIAIGFSNAAIKVWAMTPAKLRELKCAEQLNDIDSEVDDVLVRMMDDRKAETSKILLGHTGPVYNCSFTFDRSLLLSCSEDCTIRLWSLQTWTCLVVYKGHLNPVWDVKFSPHGYYFVSCSHDKTARVWATDSAQPLRIFAGHLSDVDVCTFHPNSNYIATGSSDRTVRLWDVSSGDNHVRLMTGHKGAIYSIVFSICGRYLASGSSDKVINVWDLAHGHLVASLDGHTATIHSLCFSRDGTILASGALDCNLKLWNFSKLYEDLSEENVNVSHNPNVKNGENYLLRTFTTKQSPFMALHFTRRNLLYGVGLFETS